jgi:hypothetical protein
MRVVIAAVMMCGICVADAAGQAAPPATSAATPEALVQLWFERWNALSEAPESHDALAALYAPDALHLAGPSPDQRGTATFRGPDGVRALAARIGASETRRTWRIDTETARESTAQLIHVATGPWGGASIAVQLVAVHTDRGTGKRYAVPGAAFFQIDGARFRRVRIYLGDGERAEVEAEPTRRRP